VELPSKRIYDEFLREYVEQPDHRLTFVDHETRADNATPGLRLVTAKIEDDGREVAIEGKGTGPVDGFIDALSRHLGVSISVVDYSEHSLQRGSDAAAICYMETDCDGERWFGAGINKNIVAASLKAILSAANRMLAKRQAERSSAA
jgi:2-isopropylmalate synthase